MSRSSEKNVVFSKVLAGDKRLVVTKKQVSGRTTTRNVNGQEPILHTYRYSFCLLAKGSEQPEELLWTHEVYHAPDYKDGLAPADPPRPNIQVYDALVKSDMLIVVYKQAGRTYGNVIRTGEAERPSKALVEDGCLTEDMRSQDVKTVGGTIKGSLENESLEIVLTIQNSESESSGMAFELTKEGERYKWVKKKE